MELALQGLGSSVKGAGFNPTLRLELWVPSQHYPGIKACIMYIERERKREREGDRQREREAEEGYIGMDMVQDIYPPPNRHGNPTRCLSQAAAL